MQSMSSSFPLLDEAEGRGQPSVETSHRNTTTVCDAGENLEYPDGTEGNTSDSKYFKQVNSISIFRCTFVGS